MMLWGPRCSELETEDERENLANLLDKEKIYRERILAK